MLRAKFTVHYSTILTPAGEISRFADTGRRVVSNRVIHVQRTSDATTYELRRQAGGIGLRSLAPFWYFLRPPGGKDVVRYFSKRKKRQIKEKKVSVLNDERCAMRRHCTSAAFEETLTQGHRRCLNI